MTRHTAIPHLACLSATPGLAIGLPIGTVALAATGTAPPDWIKIAPRGDILCRDRRTYTLDPDALIARFNADDTRAPIDIGHATVTDHAAPAVGWVEQLEARADGLYGKVEWLPGGKAVLAARTHRYVSPAFHHDDQNRATWLHSVALVAAPALANMPALASAQHAQEPSMKGIATAVGLQEGANEAAILAAISAGFVKKDVHEQTLAQLSAATTKLAAIEKAGHEAEVERALEEALKAKKMLPSQKPTFVAMSASVDGFAQVKALLAATAEGSFAAPSGLDGREADKGAGREKDAATLAAEATKLAGERGIPFPDAMSIVASRSTASGAAA